MTAAYLHEWVSLLARWFHIVAAMACSALASTAATMSG